MFLLAFKFNFLYSANLVRVYNDQLLNLEKAFLDTNTGIKRDGFE